MIREFGGKISGYFSRNIYVRADSQYEKKLQNFIRQCNSIDVYECIYTFDTFLPVFVNSCRILSPFYLDLDADITNEKEYQAIKLQAKRVVVFLNQVLYIPSTAIQIYYSGSKGFHILVAASVLGMPALYKTNLLYKNWAVHISQAYHIPAIDTKIYDRRRLIRVPNTINSKSGLYKIPISISELYESTYDTIRQLATKPRRLPKYDTTLSKRAASLFLNQTLTAERKRKNRSNTIMSVDTNEQQELMPCIMYMLENPVAKGSRNNTAVVLANSMLQAQYSFETVEEILQNWNQKNDPPLPERELQTTIQSAYNMFQNERTFGCASIKELGYCTGGCRWEEN